MTELEGTIIASISAIVGALAGGWAGAYFTDKKGYEREEEKERKQILGSLRAIKCELESIWQAYEKGPAKDIELVGVTRAGAPGPILAIPMYPNVSDGFFSVYRNHSTVLGIVDNQDLAKDIVLAYQRMMGVFDALRLNNTYYDPAYGSVSRGPSLATLAVAIKTRHDEDIKPHMEKVLMNLKDYLEKDL